MGWKKPSYEKSFASHEFSKYWSKDNEFSPRDVYKSTQKKFKFDCIVCNHQFESSPKNIYHGATNCPYCSGNKICDKCDECYKKSFASSPMVKYFSKDNTANPRQIFLSSGKKYIFDCDVCKHQIEKSPDTIKGSIGCPFCANQRLCNDDECDYCYKKSFASNPISKYLIDKNDCDLRKVLKSSMKRYKFKCPDCDHIFEQSPKNLTSGSICSYCNNSKLCTNDKCKKCFENSFAFNNMSKYWSKDNKGQPRDIYINSGYKGKFDCPFCNEIYIARLCSVNKGYWCRCNKNRTEAKLFKYLQTINKSVTKQVKFSWCAKKKELPFDFCIEELKIIIELDGGQHFKQISVWKSPIEQQKTDTFKMNCANENGYTVIRILQEDVWDDRNNWQLNLNKTIHKYDKPINIFVGQNMINIAGLSLLNDYANCFHTPFKLNTMVWPKCIPK